MGKSWRRTLLLGIAFLLAIAGTCFFAYRAGRLAGRIHSADEPIRPWMSVPFIAHTHHVPDALLFQAIGMQPDPHDRRSIRHLAHDLHRPVPELTAQLQKAADASARTNPSR